MQVAHPESMAPGSFFPPTQWTLIDALALTDATDTQRMAAVAALCRLYWQPLFAYARRLGHAKEDAEDLTQGFFEEVIRSNLLSKTGRNRTKLRSFLLLCFKRHINDRRKYDQAQKRGGNLVELSLDTQGEPLETLESSADSPEVLYDRQCALTLLEEALSQLKAEHEAAGKGALFAMLLPRLDPTAEEEPNDLTPLEMSPEAVRQAVFRLRRRLRTLIRALVAASLQTTDEDAIQAELHALMTLV